MGQGHVSLKAVEMLVLDEADRMLDMGFVRDVRKIIADMPSERQSLLFSGHHAEGSRETVRRNSEQPRPASKSRRNRHPLSASSRASIICRRPDKNALLAKILGDPELKRVIVFSRTKHRANRIADYLEKRGISSDAIHGNKSQGARQRALKRFRDGEARVLVATDIAARGIDVDGITHVINFELPNEAESYVHRIGRTARAGATGIAISFCEATERAYLRDIERLIKMKLTVIGAEPAGPPDAKPTPRRGRGGGKPWHKNGRKNGHKGGNANGQKRYGKKRTSAPGNGQNRNRRPNRGSAAQTG